MRFGLPPSERFSERKLLDARARELAEQSGVNWEELNNYPGYCKNIWRELAVQSAARTQSFATVGR